MNIRLSDKIRDLAKARYVGPAIAAGQHEISIRVRDILTDLEAEGLAGGGRTPQICSALRTGKFLRDNGLEIERVEAPPSGQSPTVVYHYRLARQNLSRGPDQFRSGMNPAVAEGADAWAERVTSKIRGLLKDEIAEFGGTEGFMRWVRSNDEESE